LLKKNVWGIDSGSRAVYSYGNHVIVTLCFNLKKAFIKNKNNETAAQMRGVRAGAVHLPFARRSPSVRPPLRRRPVNARFAGLS